MLVLFEKTMLSENEVKIEWKPSNELEVLLLVKGEGGTMTPIALQLFDPLKVSASTPHPVRGGL